MSVLDQAQNFSGGVVSAARQRDRWARREANATDDELREQYREAIADLEARYPDISDVPVGGAEAFARERGHGTGARSPVHEGRRRRGSTTPAGRDTSRRTSKKTSPPAGRGTPRPVPGLTPGARRSSGQRKAAKGSPTPRVDRAIRRTGIPATLDSSGSVAMAALGGTVGLGLFYLVLSSAEQPGSGAAALPSIIRGITGALHRFLSLEDILPPMGRSAQTKAELQSTSGTPRYREGPGSNVAKAAARLRRIPGPSTKEERERAAREIQQHAHTSRVGGTHR